MNDSHRNWTLISLSLGSLNKTHHPQVSSDKLHNELLGKTRSLKTKAHLGRFVNEYVCEVSFNTELGEHQRGDECSDNDIMMEDVTT